MKTISIFPIKQDAHLRCSSKGDRQSFPKAFGALEEAAITLSSNSITLGVAIGIALCPLLA